MRTRPGWGKKNSLTHFVNAVTDAKATWATGDALEKALDCFSGDVVQAVQALKEAKPAPTSALRAALQALLASFDRCAAYAFKYPFTRAERQVRDVVGFLYPDDHLLPSAASLAAIRVDLSRRGAVDIETFDVGPYRMPRLFNGLWQLSSPAWGSGSAEAQERALVGMVEVGLGAADMADHYVSGRKAL